MNDPTPYELIGGETGVRRLVDRFYDLMDSDTKAQDIRAMHAKSLRASRDKLFLFLSGWLGGPNLYIEKYGHPMLRQRHLPFAIGMAQRDQWMHCMRQALSEMPIEKTLRQKLEQAFAATADHMRNQPEHTPDGKLKIFPGRSPYPDINHIYWPTALRPSRCKPPSRRWVNTDTPLGSTRNSPNSASLYSSPAPSSKKNALLAKCKRPLRIR